jgi:hypothetical protein
MVRRLAGALKARAGTVVNVSVWHNRDQQRACLVGQPLAALPTLRAERRFIAALQT